MLAPSGDGSVVAYAEADQIPATWGSYHIASATLARSGELDDPVYEVAVERTGAQLAIPTYDGLDVLAADGTVLGVLGTHARDLPVGAVYSPVGDELYLAWAGATTSISVYDTRTLHKLRDLAPLPGLFFWSGEPANPFVNHAFNNGRLRISRDGTLIFATIPPSGVAVYPTGAAIAP